MSGSSIRFYPLRWSWDDLVATSKLSLVNRLSSFWSLVFWFSGFYILDLASHLVAFIGLAWTFSHSTSNWYLNLGLFVRYGLMKKWGFVSFLHCLVGFVGHLHLLHLLFCWLPLAPSPSPLSLPLSHKMTPGVPFQLGQSSTKRNAKSVMSLAVYIINTIMCCFHTWYPGWRFDQYDKYSFILENVWQMSD